VKYCKCEYCRYTTYRCNIYRYTMSLAIAGRRCGCYTVLVGKFWCCLLEFCDDLINTRLGGRISIDLLSTANIENLRKPNKNDHTMYYLSRSGRLPKVEKPFSEISMAWNQRFL